MMDIDNNNDDSLWTCKQYKSKFNKNYKTRLTYSDDSIDFPILDDDHLINETNELEGLNEINDHDDHDDGHEEIFEGGHEDKFGDKFTKRADYKRYHKRYETKNIWGYVVNIHDVVNFDIDLQLTSTQNKYYHNVIKNQYTYQELSDDPRLNSNYEKITNNTCQTGTAYRCRLKGIGINQQNNSQWKKNYLCMKIKQFIDRTDGWVLCNISDIDIYHRLLIDINIITSTGTVNPREYILHHMIKDDNPIFYSYVGNNNNNYKINSFRNNCNNYNNLWQYRLQ